MRWDSVYLGPTQTPPVSTVLHVVKQLPHGVAEGGKLAGIFLRFALRRVTEQQHSALKKSQRVLLHLLNVGTVHDGKCNIRTLVGLTNFADGKML